MTSGRNIGIGPLGRSSSWHFLAVLCEIAVVEKLINLFTRSTGPHWNLAKGASEWSLLVAHLCGDPNRATQCRAQSVASNFRRIRDVAPKSRYTPPNQGVTPFSGTPVALFYLRSRQGAKGGCCGGLVEGIAALWVPKMDRAIIQVALLCATKSLP